MDAHLVMGYAMTKTKMGSGTQGDMRAANLSRAAYASLESAGK